MVPPHFAAIQGRSQPLTPDNEGKAAGLTECQDEHRTRTAAGLVASRPANACFALRSSALFFPTLRRVFATDWRLPFQHRQLSGLQQTALLGSINAFWMVGYQKRCRASIRPKIERPQFLRRRQAPAASRDHPQPACTPPLRKLGDAHPPPGGAVGLSLPGLDGLT